MTNTPFNHIYWILISLYFFIQAAEAQDKINYNLDWSTYLGGASGWDQARDVCIDEEGNIIVVGGTSSFDFPVTRGTYDTSFNDGGTQIGSSGLCDVFVTKYSSNGKLLWSTFIGSPNYDRAYAVEADSAGNLVIAGRAGPGFPVTQNAVQKNFQGVNAGPYGQQNAFVAKLSSDGTHLLWSTYLGVGAMVRDFQLDSHDNIVAAFGSDPGSRTPPSSWFLHSFQSTRHGGIESGVAKLKADGTQVLWATWFGGSGDETSEVGICLDNTDRVFITGNTKSPDIPIVGKYSDASYNGGWDGFLAVFSADGSELLCSTYLGGSSDDFVLNTHALAVDHQHNVYIHCATKSIDFPTTDGVMSKIFNGDVDIAISKIAIPSGQLMLSTYIGGAGMDNPDGIYVDTTGNVFISGETDSKNFPVTINAFQPSKGAGVDAFVLLLRSDFRALLFSTYIGGPSDDRFRSGFLGNDGSLYGIGTSSGKGFPIKNATQPDYAGGGGVGDAIVVKLVKAVGH